MESFFSFKYEGSPHEQDIFQVINNLFAVLRMLQEDSVPEEEGKVIVLMYP